jgi:hypothetical protein
MAELVDLKMGLSSHTNEKRTIQIVSYDYTKSLLALMISEKTLREPHSSFIIPHKFETPTIITNSSSSMSSDQPPKEPTKRIRMEPFQIFSLRRRAEVARQNPGLSNSALLSLLGRIWRSLPQSEKEEYMELALNVIPADRPTRRRKPPAPPQPRVDDPPPVDNISPTATERPQRPEGCPQFSIIPRGSSGTQASSVSHEIVFSGHPSSE